MSNQINAVLQEELNELLEKGLFKKVRIITTPQAAEIETIAGGKVLNFCANNNSPYNFTFLDRSCSGTFFDINYNNITNGRRVL